MTGTGTAEKKQKDVLLLLFGVATVMILPPAVRPSLIDRWTRDRSRAPACCAHDGETGIDVSAQVLTRINSKTVLNPVSAGRMFRPDMLTRLTGR